MGLLPFGAFWCADGLVVGCGVEGWLAQELAGSGNRELSLALDTHTAPDLNAAVESTFDTNYATATAQ